MISTHFVVGGDGASASTGPSRRPQISAVSDELVRAAISGDRTAVARLLATIRPLVVRYCRGRLGSADRTSLSPDDVAQDVCLAVLTALPTYRPQGRPFMAFVYRVAANKLVDAHRAVSRARSEPVAEVPDATTSAAGPEQRALQGELSAQLRALLEELPDKQRRILVLRVIVGLSAEETGEIVGATPGAVRLAQHRASTRMRKIAVGVRLAADAPAEVSVPRRPLRSARPTPTIFGTCGADGRERGQPAFVQVQRVSNAPEAEGRRSSDA